MSHFSTIKTEMRDVVLVKEALAYLECRVVEGTDLSVTSDTGETTQVDLLADVGAGTDRIGFIFPKGGECTVVADWFRVEQSTDVLRNKWMNSLKQNYARAGVHRQAREKGYVVEQETILENGDVRLVVSEPV
jgi:hypothetical protein